MMFGRRILLKGGGALGLGLLANGLTRAGEVCGLTPTQIEGPFYPVADQADKETDLTWVEGHSVRAKGQVVVVEGQVRGLDCAPLAGCLVEIWQACASGRYNHPSETNPAPLDPNFQYWGRVVADATGSYRFKTIRPGAYPAERDWTRPPHLHFKVAAPGLPVLVTQMYSDGDPLNGKDLIVRDLSPAERRRVTVPFAPAGDGLRGRFDIVLGGRRSADATPYLD